MTSAAIKGSVDVRSTRELLIEQGLRAFTTRGFDGANLREIERESGVGRGLVAHHFGTKDGLWRECVNWLMGRYHRELEEVRENLADVSSVERARVLLRFMCGSWPGIPSTPGCSCCRGPMTPNG